MILGAAFDGSVIHKQGRYTDNVSAVLHDVNLEDDFAILRDHGFTFFRDNARLHHTWSDGKYNWSWLDRLAKISNQQIQLTISHYEYMDLCSFAGFCKEVALRYKGDFHSFIPVCESGYWAGMLTNGCLPHHNNWWEAWPHISLMNIYGAQAIKAYDSSCRIAMSEPWNHYTPLEDRARPFDTQLGRPDKVAEANKVHTWEFGEPRLLDIIGLNIYNQENVRELVVQAEQRYPGKQIMIAETNCNWGHRSQTDYIKYMEQETVGTSCEIVMWCPVLPMLCHGSGDMITTGFLYDLNRQRVY